MPSHRWNQCLSCVLEEVFFPTIIIFPLVLPDTRSEVGVVVVGALEWKIVGNLTINVTRLEQLTHKIKMLNGTEEPDTFD